MEGIVAPSSPPPIIKCFNATKTFYHPYIKMFLLIPKTIGYIAYYSMYWTCRAGYILLFSDPLAALVFFL